MVMGTLASGSSALIDMLYEYENINVLPYEFNDYRRPGFVCDQLSPESSENFPNVIDKNLQFTNTRWKLIYKSSIWKLGPYESLNNIWKKDFKNKKLKAYKNSLTELYHTIFLQEISADLKSDKSFEEKIELSNKWIQKIGSLFPPYYDYTLFNQPLHPWSDPKIWTRVFRPFKLICVFREPKDQLAEMVRRDIAFHPFRSSDLNYAQFNIVSIYGNDRKGRLKFLKDALLKRLEKFDQWLTIIDPDNILFVDFDYLINDYDACEVQIENFLGNISGRHKLRKKYFNPEIAQRNCIGIYKKYLNEEDLVDLAPLEDWYNKKIKSIQPAPNKDNLNQEF